MISILKKFNCIIIFILSIHVLLSQEKSLTPELILSIKPISDVQISPDGNKILFHTTRLRTSSEKPGPAWSEIWIIDTKIGLPHRFTFSEKSDRSARWSPDGKTIAFLSTRGESEKAQIYLISANGGEAHQLTNAEVSISSFKWSNDGSMIAYTMPDPKTKEEQNAEKEGKDWIIADQNYKHTRLYAIRIKTKETWKITKDDLTIWDYDWSPNNKNLVILASETPKIDDQYMASKVMIVDTEGGKPRLLVKTEGKIESPRWSPDGNSIAWLGSTKLSDPFAGSVFVVSTVGGKPENLTPNYNGSAISLFWLPQTNNISFCAIERQATVLRTINLKTKKIYPILTQPIIYSTASFSSDGKFLTVAGHTPTHPTEVWFGKTGSELKRLTKFNPQLENIPLGIQEEIKWNTNDGLTIEGILIKPLGYMKGNKYPLFIQYHGGPEAADLNGWHGSFSRWGQLLASKGIAVLYPNYRGSIGRGVEFSEASQGDMMGKEFDDVLAGIDYLVKEGIVDPNRVALGGGSYGGYAAAWAATKHSHRFKLAVVWMGGTNRISKVGTADNYKEESIVHWKDDLYDNFELYWDRSPIKWIKNAQTPTLILHGEKDTRVPVSQGQELYTALKWKGVPVEFVVYPREGHGISEYAHQLDFLQRLVTWCERYLK